GPALPRRLQVGGGVRHHAQPLDRAALDGAPAPRPRRRRGRQPPLCGERRCAIGRQWPRAYVGQRQRGAAARSRAEVREDAMKTATLAALACTVSVVTAIIASDAALAQGYPSRTNQAVIPFAPGNANDVVGRIVLDQLSRQVGQPIVI